MESSIDTLPRWNMQVVYPGLDSAEFEASFQEMVQAIDRLVTFFDEQAIMLRETSLPITPSTAATFEQALEQINILGRHIHLLDSYITSFTTTDSRDMLAQSRCSQLQKQQVRFSQLQTRFTAWIGSLKDVEALIAASAPAREHAHALHRAVIEATHLMSPAEEALAVELRLTGGSAWAKLYHNFTSQITTEVVLPTGPQRLPMTAIRNLAFDPDRKVRQAGYEAEIAAWEANALPIAASLNSLKGEMLALSRKRGWDSPLDVALFYNAIDRETLKAMMETSREAFPEFRRYLKAKARALGVPRLAWYDLFAPVGKSQKQWSFEEARAFIIEQFGTYSDALADLARRAFEERWIDAGPRDGKRGGAFCMWLRNDESRILANYQSAYGGMGTLAHELGHAYHNLRRAPSTYIQRRTPMTLAETASTFCETIVREAALAHADRLEQLAIIEASLQDTLQVVVDITSRFIFESQLFEKRQDQELSAEEFSEIMLQAQRDTYADGLDGDLLHPYMWAVKPHYYDSTFYNFPYMFGQLFSLGLYARYRDDPEAFKRSYDTLLSNTGMASAADLAAAFGFDLRSPDFWR
ncbi:MAG: M3 family oligoendopeptidase, partial [Anaerolineae bacterium]|nr:M3 family oligoendopeptidase [Anaerolineae bacterium]